MSEKNTSTIQVICPCCESTLTIDTALAAVLKHKVPPKPQPVAQLKDAPKMLKEEATRRDEKYQQMMEAGNGMQIAYLKLGDTVLELTHRSDGFMKGFHFCLETDHFDTAVAELQNKGIEIAQRPHPTAARETREKGWRRVVFRGPDGELIEIRG